jgi:hypothetical protein
MSKSGQRNNLTLVHGGAAGKDEGIAARTAGIRLLPAKKRLDAIISDPRGAEIARSLSPLDFYMTVKEVGEVDALELMALASPRQFSFLLDMELWEKWSYRPEKGEEWLEYLSEAGEGRMLELLGSIDGELLTLMLKNEIDVTGGLGVVEDDEERLREWDHSFDGLYMIGFRNPKTARRVGTVLDLLYRSRRELYVYIMEGIKGEADAELEETCYRMRSGRLGDYGFPDYVDALSIYARIDPDSFAPAASKEAVPAEPEATLPAIPGEESLLRRILARDGSGSLRTELRYLISSAIAADEGAFADPDRLKRVLQRVDGYLTIALEHLSGGDEERGAEIAGKEYLKRLFGLGYGIVRRLAGAAGNLGDDYPSRRLAEGLTRERPLFYRGLDPDHADAYREFSSLRDVRTVEEILSGNGPEKS